MWRSPMGGSSSGWWVVERRCWLPCLDDAASTAAAQPACLGHLPAVFED
jgi:hypothetical protein